MAIASGHITITAVYDGAPGAKGATGATGAAGAAGAKGDTGDGIESMTALYAISDSATEAPDSGWGLVVPEWTSGNHIWQKWAVVMTGGGSYNTTPVCTTLPAGDAKTRAEDAIAAAETAADQALSALNTIVDIQEGLRDQNIAISDLAAAATTYAISQDLLDEVNARQQLADAMESYDKKADREAVIWEDASGIHISDKTKANPEFETVISQTGMDCKFSGTTKAYFHTDKSESTAFHATKSLSVGQSSGTVVGWFQWTHEDDDGSLSLSYRGGAQ